MLIDDLDMASKQMEWHYKRWCDRYPMTVEVKGGTMVINPELIIITSQYTPEQIWEGDQTTISAMQRRLAIVCAQARDTKGSQREEPVSAVLPDRLVGSWLPSAPFCVGTYENGYRSYTTYERF